MQCQYKRGDSAESQLTRSKRCYPEDQVHRNRGGPENRLAVCKSRPRMCVSLTKKSKKLQWKDRGRTSLLPYRDCVHAVRNFAFAEWGVIFPAAAI